MNKEVLALIADLMDSLGIRYSFLRYNAEDSEAEYPYFIGEYIESPEANEDGHMSIEFILTGFTKGTWLSLEEAKAAIAEAFRLNTTVTGGYGVCITYESAYPVPQEDEELKSIEITLSVHVWRSE